MVAESHMKRPTLADAIVSAKPKRKATTYNDVYNRWLAKHHDHHVAREKADAWQARQKTKAFLAP